MVSTFTLILMAQVALPDPVAAGWKGAPVCEVLRKDVSLRVLRCTFPPGVGQERHFHAPHFGYALSGGRMRITDSKGTRDADLKTGSSFSSDGIAWHEVLNIGRTTVQYLIVEPGDASKSHVSDGKAGAESDNARR